jgi:hypothetical protein
MCLWCYKGLEEVLYGSRYWKECFTDLDIAYINNNDASYARKNLMLIDEEIHIVDKLLA